MPGGRTDSSRREMHTGAGTEFHMLFSAHCYIFILTQFETYNDFISQSVADFAQLALEIDDRKFFYMC